MQITNLKELIQSKAVPWLSRMREFESEIVVETTPQFLVAHRNDIIARSKKVEDKIRTIAPKVGATLDVVDGESLEFLPIVLIGTAVLLGGGAVYSLDRIMTYLERQAELNDLYIRKFEANLQFTGDHDEAERLTLIEIGADKSRKKTALITGSALAIASAFFVYKITDNLNRGNKNDEY